MEFHLHRGRLQSDPHPQATGDLMPSRKNPLLGRWRITEMALWDTDFVDLLEPAYITFEAKGGGEFVFGAVHGDLDCRYGPDGGTLHLGGFRRDGPHLRRWLRQMRPRRLARGRDLLSPR